jgi:hypothetical protein
VGAARENISVASESAVLVIVSMWVVSLSALAKARPAAA